MRSYSIVFQMATSTGPKITQVRLHAKTAPGTTGPKLTQVRLHVKTAPQMRRPKLAQVHLKRALAMTRPTYMQYFNVVKKNIFYSLYIEKSDRCDWFMQMRLLSALVRVYTNNTTAI